MRSRVAIGNLSAASVSAVPVMHEEMHDRAGRQKQPGQIWDRQREVRAMLGDQKIRGDQREPKKNRARSGFATTVTRQVLSSDLFQSPRGGSGSFPSQYWA
jgi:hypothetical protein